MAVLKITHPETGELIQRSFSSYKEATETVHELLFQLGAGGSIWTEKQSGET